MTVVRADAVRPMLFVLLTATVVVSGGQYVWVWGRRAGRHWADGNPGRGA